MLNPKLLQAFEKTNKKCRFCNDDLQKEYAVPTYSYWQGGIFFCHESCRKNGEAEEKQICQTIDADCNDCFFFQRGAVICKGTYEGHCQKFNKTVRAYPLQGTGHICFKHRNEKG